MRLAALLAFALTVTPAAATAQAPVAVRINIGLPAVPPLVVVQPGVQVVADIDEEVFFTDDWYWLRRSDGWYRARTPQASFAFVDPRVVPVVLVRMEPGRYRRWHPVSGGPPRVQPPPPVRSPPPPPPPSNVLRAEEIKAGRVRARVIYVKELKARGWQIERILDDRDKELWERGRGDGDIRGPEVVADVIYAKEIKAGWIEAGEVHAEEVKLGR